MKTLFDPAARDALLARVDRLTPEHRARWGKMNVRQMVCHVSDGLRASLGELECRPKNSFFSNPVARWFIISVMPWPKGKAQTAPELLTTQPAEFEADRAALRTLMDRFSRGDPAAPWPAHPAFGDLSGRLWGRLKYRHLDHHLRQFGE
ncbi:MAG TPA: DUF1569 domain-containing protein [Longimicrobiaceae bacterium]|nr:DUF1569 domain-containing protein [Longimicrobiaceae bacterium]